VQLSQPAAGPARAAEAADKTHHEKPASAGPQGALADLPRFNFRRPRLPRLKVLVVRNRPQCGGRMRRTIGSKQCFPFGSADPVTPTFLVLAEAALLSLFMLRPPRMPRRRDVHTTPLCPEAGELG